jgi:YfiH family protein
VLANADWIGADWPAPARVRAIVTTRHGGASSGVYTSFNLATHCGDRPSCVAENRARLTARHRLPTVFWLHQVHGTDVVEATVGDQQPRTADASWSRSAQFACAVLTADCLPVLICDRAGSVVAAAHCGWRGLASGVLQALVRGLPVGPGDLLAWFGPAIGPARYQVGADVREALLATLDYSVVDRALRPSDVPDKWQADLYAIARWQLNALGVSHIYGGGLCTHGDARFYSHRRDGVTGRMASLIWLSDEG